MIHRMCMVTMHSFLAMATSPRTLTAEEVLLTLLDQQEELEDALGVDLDAESEDEDLPEGDLTDRDGTQALVQPELLAGSGFSLVAQAFDYLEPSQMDSLLLLDPNLMDVLSSKLSQ